MAEIKNYDASSIKVLEGLEAVRKRPGMYIGSTGPKGLHHMIWEIVDNSIDEAMGGHANTVTITLHTNNSIEVEDNGRGIPVDPHPQTGKSTLETVLTVLHAGGKFDNSSYKVSGGLHGVGASVVNALSEWMTATVFKNNKIYQIDFVNGGNPKSEIKIIGDTKKRGTNIKFFPDFTIMEKTDFDSELICERLQQLAYLNKNIKIVFINEFLEETKTWCYSGGINEYVSDINSNKEPLHETIVYGEIEEKVKVPNVTVESYYDVRVEIAFQFNKTYSTSLFSFCNNIHTTEGGTHEEGFRLAMTKVINKYALEKKFIKEGDDKCNKDDVVEGIGAIISIKHPNPQYEGQTKRKLGNTEVRALVNSVTSTIFEKFLMENPEEAALIVKKIILAMEARKKSFEVREATRRKSPFDSNSMPGKLADCSSKEKSISELFLVEGDSAGGSAKLGRDRVYQAILSLKGKILNVEKQKTTKILEHTEILDLITAIGGGINPEFNIEKIRYEKIIIMTDADVDGSHIRILLLTFFYRYMTELIEKGCIFIAQPPLYKFTVGKSIKYAYSDAELEELKKTVENGRFNVQRYKGLGEMNPDQLWETTLDPTKRVLIKINIDDAIKADKIFSDLMGLDIIPRKEFIAKNARYAKNIDA